MIETYEQLHAALLAWHQKTNNFYCEEIVLELYAGKYEYGLRYDGASSYAREELDPTFFNLPLSHEDFEKLIEGFADEVDEAEADGENEDDEDDDDD
jgi:hypothetical protein